ncbi:NAD(P)-binding protein [Aspergillus piperis CBS 112811]|uniref:NAD(P)-binding protein n=1 Tax=Aspergillus piperis CBS 112811 TaxID=1448313 RepID=A0A8G1VGP8_9EURO|nr:NAD(P)-binding protein [Aspergillus piperis CBS 112811]RAH52519.1 NAD(P)-binding protein [Aspergillus piperis CBS 112811]
MRKALIARWISSLPDISIFRIITTSMTKTWLITGASSGLGAALAHHVIRAGHKVVGAVRNIAKAQQTYPHSEELGGAWAQLDVTDAKTKEHVARLSREHDETEIHQQIDTNLYGPIRVIQGCLPSMREKKTGCIVNISSVAGLIGRPATALYSASKFGLEGLSESLASELGEFGIRVLVVQPGGFRTGFLSAYVKPAAGLNPAYEGKALGQAMQRYDTADGTQRGDPEKAAARILMLSSSRVSARRRLRTFGCRWGRIVMRCCEPRSMR